ncbi:hypothetical protein EW146_g1209 [Bondarzewia mesenterica]|uniref:NAD(P)-binding domain-containing protein n=1 Tax=Bondarzewia mesenterica TaxID=1095465 RepID=A0A4S4M4I3_9AGAM|nr:hypothetical protein EW146_g1209 [Bondarzewia mesenterica]
MPRVLVLGGTGPSGIILIRELLSHSYTVVVYARTPSKLPADISSHEDVTIIKGELSDADSLSKALEGVEAVLSALGPTSSHPRDTPLARGYKLITDLMLKRGITRIIVLGTASTADEHDKFSLIFWFMVLIVRLFANNAYKEIVAIGKAFRESPKELRWTIVRVPLLTNASKKDVAAGYVGDKKVGIILPRAAFAAFMVQELEEENWVRKAPAISRA